jgi:hypothetical protein
MKLSTEEELLKLQLRQARRREIPHMIVKWAFGSILLIFLLGLLGTMHSCGDRRQTKQETKKTIDAIWAGDAEAHKQRIP